MIRTLIVFVFLGWLMIGTSGLAAEDAAATAGPAQPNSAGNIVVEAEIFAAQSNADLRSWKIVKDAADQAATADASGKAFVRCLPDTRKTHADKLIKGQNFSPEPGKMAVLDYPVEFAEPGRYYVWVRAFSSGSEDNGLHVGLDGEWPESGQRMQWCEGKNQWTWGCAQRTEEQHCGVPMQIYLDIKEAGKHTVSFSMREDGFTFDQFLLTRDVDFRP